MITKDIVITNLSHEVTKQDGTNDGIWYFGDKINLNEEVIIGFSPTNYHCFIICGDYEFHPRFTTNPCKLVPSRKNNIRAALFIRIKGIDQKRLVAFQTFLSQLKGRHTPSCQEGLLQALNIGLGLRIPNVKISRILPHQFITELFFKGLIDQNGEKVKFEIYSTREKPLTQIFEEIEKVEKKLTWVFNLSSNIYSLWKRILPWTVLK